MADGTEHKHTYSQFSCIGTGFSAIALGATLKQWYGISDICFFERHKQLGGAWLVNTYPGCACDIPSVLYSLSFEPNPTWSRTLPSASEIWEYLNRVASKYNLPSKMSFGVNVERCQWIEERSRWRLDVRHLATESIYIHESQFLFAANGQLVTPRKLGVPGVESFKGPIFHASRWDDKVDLTDKNVIVFGNGCTAAQIVPSVVAKTKHLTQMVRSKHWILPPIEERIPRWLTFLYNWIPGFMAIVRFVAFLMAENELRGFYLTGAGAKFRQGRRKAAESYMRNMAPAKYHDLLLPDFDIGCKRRIFDSGYLQSLHADNLTLTNDPALEILQDGVRTKDKTIPADVIILANGYVTNQFLGNMEVIGRRGGTIGQHWDNLEEPRRTTALR